MSIERSRPGKLSGPEHLGRYELLDTIGSGGMATVYLGRARGVGGFERLVAVKLCHKHLLEEQSFVHMFLDEARLAARIHHMNVVSTLDVAHDEHLYMVMEYVEGGSLATLLKEHRRQGQSLPVGVALRIIIDALKGLHAAHELLDNDGRPLNLIHRDVSPQNILIGSDGVSRITDFGIAKAEARDATTRPGEIKGKFSYLAPEQLRGLTITRKVDVFAAAVVLWEALSGRKLFRSDTPSGTFVQILSGPIRSVSSYRDDVPKTLDEVIRDGLERDPDRRIPTAGQLATDLEGCGATIATHEEVGRLLSSKLGQLLEKRRAALRSGEGRVSFDTTPLIKPMTTSPRSEVSKAHRIIARGRARLVLLLALFTVIVVGAILWSILGTERSAPAASQAEPGQRSAVVEHKETPSQGVVTIGEPTPITDAAVDAEASGDDHLSPDAGEAVQAKVRHRWKRRPFRDAKGTPSRVGNDEEPSQPTKTEPSFSAL